MRNPRRPSALRIIGAILVGLAALVILVLAGRTDDSNKQDDRPAGPTATLAPSPDALDAEVALEGVDGPQMCNDMLDKSVVEYNTQRKPIVVSMTTDGETLASLRDMYCTYSSPNRWAVGQVSYQKLTTLGVEHYNTTRAGRDDMLIAKPIPARDMPAGVTSAFYFTPADMPADMSSLYRNPGVQMLVGDELVVISFEDFDVLPSALRVRIMNNALKDVVSAK